MTDWLTDQIYLSVHSPRSDVARAYDRFAGATKDACEIVALIATCLYVVRELHDHDISQCVTILSQSQRERQEDVINAVTTSSKLIDLRAVCHSRDSPEVR